jgi:hypothetical protein
MFIGLSTAISQNYMSDQEAVTTLRIELNNITSDATVTVAPSNPSTFAYVQMLQRIYKHLGTAITNGTATSSSVRDAIQYARDTGMQAELVEGVFYESAFDDVTALLTN